MGLYRWRITELHGCNFHQQMIKLFQFVTLTGSNNVEHRRELDVNAENPINIRFDILEMMQDVCIAFILLIKINSSWIGCHFLMSGL